MIDVGHGRVQVLGRGAVVTAAEYRHHPGPHRDPDEEAFYHLTVILPSSGSWSFRSGLGAFEVDPGIALLGRPGERYRAGHPGQVATDRSRYLTFEGLDASGDDGLLAEFRDQESPLFRRSAVPRTARLRWWEDELWAEASRGGPASGLRLDLLALQLLAEIIRMNSESAPAAPVVPPHVHDRVQAARRYLQDHLEEEVAMIEVSRAAALSPFHLSRMFRQTLGVSPHQYLLRLRIERAARLLLETPFTITQIAERVGFGTPSHFTATFRRRMGVTPSAYRRDAWRNLR